VSIDLSTAQSAEQTSNEVIEGLKLIRLNSARIDEPDDPIYPYKLVVNLSPPELMQIAFVMLHGGSEEMIVRAMTREAVDRFIEINNLRRHTRLRWMTIEGPDGTKEEIRR
jgi:hypothetical protein